MLFLILKKKIPKELKEDFSLLLSISKVISQVISQEYKYLWDDISTHPGHKVM